jgi:hypothetical protein
MAQCERIPGPSAEELIDFIMTALEQPKPGA